MRKNALVPEPKPEGKKIEEVIIEVEDTFDPRDQGQISKVPIIGIAPKYANYLHVTSKRYVAAREVLFEVGDKFQQALAEETERNLRAIVIFAIARVVVAKGSAPDTVKVLVATKDLWSLRLETDFQVSSGRLDFVRVNLVERNLLGRYKLVSANLGVTRDTFSLGQSFADTRVLGSRIAVEESAALAFGRGGRGIEGGSGHVAVGQPLYSLASKWAFEVATDFSYAITRSFRGGDFFRCFNVPRGQSPITCDDSISSTTRLGLLSRHFDSFSPIYASELASVGASTTRRFGDQVKHDVSFGYTLRHRKYTLLGDFPNDTVREAVRSLFVPRSEDAAYVFGSYRTFDASFVQLRNIGRFALTEDYQYGHDVRFLARWSNKIFGIDNIFVELDGSAQYRWLIGGENVLTVSARAESRAEGDGVVNKRFTFFAENISPVVGIGRIIFQALAIFRFDDRDNIRSTIGGNVGLRGYDTDEFRGRNVVNMHLEYRTLPKDLLTLQVGLVGFYDAGHAADEISQLKLRHSIGVGARIFIPQINRAVIRIDFGQPLNEGGPGNIGRQFAFSFDQAF